MRLQFLTLLSGLPKTLCFLEVLLLSVTAAPSCPMCALAPKTIWIRWRNVDKNLWSNQGSYKTVVTFRTQNMVRSFTLFVLDMVSLNTGTWTSPDCGLCNIRERSLTFGHNCLSGPDLKAKIMTDYVLQIKRSHRNHPVTPESNIDCVPCLDTWRLWLYVVYHCSVTDRDL